MSNPLPALASAARECAATYWRDGDYLRASAWHARALLLEAGVDVDERPVDPIEAIAARMRELQGMGRRT